MIKNSSIKNTKQVFEYLQNIKIVEPSNVLYHKTLEKLQKQNTIPLYWVKVAVCFLLAFFSVEFYVITKNTFLTNNDISVVIYKINNTLYNE